MYSEQIHDKPLPFIETDKLVACLCVSIYPSNHSDVLHRVSACFQNILKDEILIYFLNSGQEIPTPQGIKVKVVVIF